MLADDRDLPGLPVACQHNACRATGLNTNHETAILKEGDRV